MKITIISNGPSGVEALGDEEFYSASIEQRQEFLYDAQAMFQALFNATVENDTEQMARDHDAAPPDSGSPTR
jgi:hypothetical protein